MPASALHAHILAFVFLSQALAAPPTAVYLDAWGGVSLTEYGSPPPPPVSAGGGSLTQPRAAQAPNGDTYMVVMDQWGSLWGNVFSAATRSWYGWRQSGGGLVGWPSVAVGPDGVAWVVVRSSFNALWLNSLAPAGFGSWTSLGGIVDGDPAITITSTGMAYIVARDDIGRVWLVRAVNGVSQGWSLLGGVILGDPAVVAGLNGTAHVIARDPNSYPWVATINGTTATWTGTPTALDSPASGIHVDNVVTVTAIRSGQVWSAPFFVASPPSWGTWSPLGQAATSASAASDQTSLAVAARDPAGQLVWYRGGAGWSNYGSLFAGGPLSAAPTGRSTSFGSFPTTIATSPPGLTVTVDGVSCTAPCTFQWFPGSSHTIAAPTSQQFAGSTYWYSFWSDKLGQSHTITAPAQADTITATMVAGTDPLVGTTFCLSNTPTPGICTVPTGANWVTSTLTIARSGITLTGGSTDRSQTVLVRANVTNHRMVAVDHSSALTGIRIQNLTFCGNSALTTAVSGSNPSPVCPATRTLPVCTLCEDLAILHADMNVYPGLSSTYAVTVDNVLFEDAPGQAISLYASYPSKKVNDIQITRSAVNRSAVTGLLVGVNGVSYRRKDCDNHSGFANDPNVYAPRNIRIVSNNRFERNFTGAIGVNQGRHINLSSNNTFTSNYIQPQAGNIEGGTAFFDECTDTIDISSNTFTGPSSYNQTGGLELWGRNITVRNNNISGYPNEGIGLNSVLSATVEGNQVHENNWNLQTPDEYPIGGIQIWTSQPWGYCEPVPRDTSDVRIQAGNSSINQAYGIGLGDRSPRSRNVLNTLSIFGNTLSPNYVSAISHYNPFVSWSGTVNPTPVLRTDDTPWTPRALSVDAVQPSKVLCKSPGNVRQTFVFSGADLASSTNVTYIQGFFSISGDPFTGPQGRGCRFLYHRPTNTIYLDDTYGGYTWSGGSSPVGQNNGGITLSVPIVAGESAPSCRIYAGSSQSHTSAEGPIFNLQLDIEFPGGSGISGVNKLIYESIQNSQGQRSRESSTESPPRTTEWPYFGWWASQ